MSKTVIAIITFFAGTLLAAAASVGLVMYSSQFPTEKELKLRDDLKETNGQVAELTEKLTDTQKQLDAWQKKLPELHKQIRAAEDQLSRRQRELEKVNDKINEASRDLDNLGKAISAVKELRKSEFAMIGGDSILGISVNQDQFFVTAEVEDQLARIARQAVVRWRMPLYTSDADLCRKLSTTYDPGQSLYDSDQQRLDAIYRMHRFVAPAPDGKAEMVHLQDVGSNVTRIGFYQDHDQRSVTLNTVDNRQETVMRSQVAPGSALRGDADAIVEAAQHLQFLDLCCLEIARLLGTPTGQRNIPPRVAVLVDCIVPGRSRFGGQGMLQNQNVEGATFTVVLPRTQDLFQGELDRQTWSREIEDTLYEKLIKLNVPVLERQYLEALDRERLLASEQKQTYPAGLRMAATHLFVCKIDLSAVNGKSRLAVRLVDIASDEALWAGNFTPADPLEQHTRFHVASGDLFVINSTKLKSKEPVPIVRNKLDPEDPSTLNNRLVVFEKGLGSKSQAALRDPFSSEITLVDLKHIDRNSTVRIRTGEDVPRDLLPKYITYSVFATVMPRAGLIMRDDNDYMEVRMRDADKIVSIGDSLTAFHHVPGSGQYQPPARFPNHLAVNNLSQNGMRLADGLGRVNLIWSENEAITHGDIVVPPGQLPARVIFEGFSYEQPPEDVWKIIKGGTNKREKYHRLSEELGYRLTRGLAKACAFVGINVVNNTSNTQHRLVRGYTRRVDDPQANVSYTIRGAISPYRQSTFKVDLFVLDQNQNPVRTEQFLVPDWLIENWNPTM